jgi:hypothetical protein
MWPKNACVIKRYRSMTASVNQIRLAAFIETATERLEKGALRHKTVGNTAGKQCPCEEKANGFVIVA